MSEKGYEFLGGEVEFQRYQTITSISVAKLLPTYGKLKNYYTVDDIVQEITISILNQKVVYDSSKCSLGGFINKLATNKCIDLYKYCFGIWRDFSLHCDIQEGYNSVDNTKLYSSTSAVQSPEDEVIDNMLMEAFQEKLKFLHNVRQDTRKRKIVINSKGEKRVKVLRLYKIVDLKIKGYTNEEIGNMFGINKSQVAVIVRNHKKKIRELIPLYFH